MKRFLIIEEDLRLSGTSQGIISRSFIGYLNKCRVADVIDVIYIHRHRIEEGLFDLLPINNISCHFIKTAPNLLVRFINKVLRLIGYHLFYDDFIEKKIRVLYNKVEVTNYDYILVRSTGYDCLSIRGLKNSHIIDKAIIFFNEPYPVAFSAGRNKSIQNLDLFRLKRMQEIVRYSGACVSTKYLGQDLQFLFGSSKKFFELPHVFDHSVFPFDIESNQDSDNITIGYHGSTNSGRDITVILDAFVDLLGSDDLFDLPIEFILRIKSENMAVLVERYKKVSQIKFLPLVNSVEALTEQINKVNINIMIENGPLYSSSLLGKAPILAYANKPFLCVSPLRSELREIIKNEFFIAGFDKNEIIEKLKHLIIQYDKLNPPLSFKDYFDLPSFQKHMNSILRSLS